MTQLELGGDTNQTNANENPQHANAENVQTNGTANKRPKPARRYKQVEIRIASQNVHGRTGSIPDEATFIELFNGMMTSQYHIALLQDTQHGYKGTNQQALEEPQFNLHGESGTIQTYFANTHPTHEDKENLFWPFSAIWSECDNTASHKLGSAGVAIVLSKLAREALQRAIDSLGHDKA